ncbi:MAG: molybdenum cofactor biosynthesis protein MoaE [Acidobacteria bacterium]|nr:molybdenum cofactor biosynthesis protein MoaE [Acidobacteriota bacterium]
MQIKVLFFGALKDIVGLAEECVIVEEGSNVGRLFQMYTERFPTLAPHSGSLLFSRNREFVRQEERLREGDEVAFLPPVSGGATDLDVQNAPAIHRLTRDAIDTRALASELQRNRDGAVAIFEGVVRDHSGDKRTLYLEYEAYESMVLEKMRQIIAEIRTKFDVDGVGIVHRLGRLEIGEASVVIVVTSEHRGAAFEACRYAIDRLKRIVPIWKKEFFAGGGVWVEGERDACNGEQPS